MASKKKRPLSLAPSAAPSLSTGLGSLTATRLAARVTGARVCFGKPIEAAGRTVVPVASLRVMGGMGFGHGSQVPAQDPSGAAAGEAGGAPGAGVGANERRRRRGRRSARGPSRRLHRDRPRRRPLPGDRRVRPRRRRGRSTARAGRRPRPARGLHGARRQAAWRRGFAVASSMAAAVISTSRRSSSASIASGGISTMTSPSGRMIAPRLRAASATWCPMRAAAG